MTPISHGACGLAVGGILSPLIKRVFKVPYRALVPLFLVGALIPDIDGLSLLFSHRVYSGHYWYSHHMAAHSFTGAAFFASIVSLIYITVALFIRGIRNHSRHERVPLEYRFRRWAGAGISIGELLYGGFRSCLRQTGMTI